MKIFDFIKSLFVSKKPEWFPGVLGERNTDNVYHQSEVVAGISAPMWVEKKDNEWKTFVPQWQNRTSACVAFTIAMIAQILYFLKTGRKIKFSPGWVYKQRDNKPDGGMWIDDVIKIASKGMITEELYPSEGLTEAEINNLPEIGNEIEVADGFAISPNWIELPLDFETVASTLQATQKGIMGWFEFGPNEWFGRLIPIILGIAVPWKHSICFVDFGLKNGVKVIKIYDSAEKDIPERFITREEFNRCILARYPLNFTFEKVSTEPGKPHHHFPDGTTLNYSPTFNFNLEVVELQDILKYEGLFPINIPSTGYYGKATAEAVLKFQKKYHVDTDQNLDKLGGRIVGPKTVEKLNDVYGL